MPVCQGCRVRARHAPVDRVFDAYCRGAPDLGGCLAKAVVLCTEYELRGDCFHQPSHSSYIVAVLPASHRIYLRNLEAHLDCDAVLANEYEIEELFEDCSPGAIPPIGECYGLDVIVDEIVLGQPEVYLEAGDHETLDSSQP